MDMALSIVALQNFATLFHRGNSVAAPDFCSRILCAASLDSGQIVRSPPRRVARKKAGSAAILIGLHSLPVPFPILNVAVGKGPGGTIVMAGAGQISPLIVGIVGFQWNQADFSALSG